MTSQITWRDLQLNLSITATLGTEESSRCEEVTVNGGGGGGGGRVKV